MTQNRSKAPLIIIAGPTAVGKSDAAVQLAKEIGGEVISADSMQIYRGMDIGSAKVTKAEMQGIPHYLIDVMDPHEDYNVTRFQEMAKAAVSEVLSHGKIPILCGGTGFYIQALLYEIDFASEEDGERGKRIREELSAYAAQHGAAKLHGELRKIDPESADAIPENNIKRVIRAIEYFRIHGKKISEHNLEQSERKKDPPYEFRFFVLTDDRKLLYERIDRRVDRMMEAGLLEEVRALKEAGIPRERTAMQGIGYRELYGFLAGETGLSEAVEKIKQNSRHYAKRQLTWFKREPAVIWINRSETEDIIYEFRKHLQGFWNL